MDAQRDDRGREGPAVSGNAVVPRDRNLDWDGCHNVRDLGGLRTADGRETLWGALVRSDAPERLSPAGWRALTDHGVRTVVDLRNDGDWRGGTVSRPAGLTTVRVPLDDRGDTAFWTGLAEGLYGTPLYYRPFLERKAERCAAAISAIARAEPGGVVVHCMAGRDRTGLVTLLMLALAGVPAADIAADYELSAERLRPLFVKLGEPDEGPRIQAMLARANTTAREVIVATVESLDVESYLRGAGLGDGDLTAARARLVGSVT
ncbi:MULTISPECIES: tyrosine-protein phosphatase [unclassified Streptosporangium]|uniref:tyrosine-protein phosphatase n=1 Tax=unclassified Streptosporangium TaxID=2632669 RepID=UPI002E2A4240|nr:MULTISPECIES: tyrosine-protein phosphatase [unclassified Streptosporangium]